MAEPSGIVARTIAALRYAVTGTPPEWFGPGIPLPDQAPPDVKGRTWDFPSFVNYNYTPRKTEPLSFAKLKALADNCEPLKLVMGRQRSLMTSMEWTVKLRKTKPGQKVDDAGADEIIAFLEMPDKSHDWAQWLGAMLDQVFVYDALSIYDRRTVGGDPWAFEIVDGATITPLVDQWGRQPLAPDVAYQQVLKGLPAVKYTADELLYYPENYRVDHIYGCSRVERIVSIAEASIAQLKSQLGYFTHGNIGDGFFSAPDAWQPDQIKQFENAWNAQMSADGGARIADRRQAPWLPGGSQFHPTNIDLFKQGFDEWLIRLICFSFDVSPTPFIKQAGLGHGSAQSDKEAAEEGGVAQLMQLVRRLMNRLIATKFNRPDLEFAWIEDRELDPKTAAEIDDIRLRNGSRTLNEVRDRNGDAPQADGDVPLIYTTQGAVKLADVVNPPPPPTALAQPAPGEVAALDDEGAAGAGAVKPDKTDEAAAKVEKALAKAAARQPDTDLVAAITDFLAAKGTEIAAQLGDALGLAKVGPMEDYSDRIEHAFDDIEWDWSPLAETTEPMIARIAISAGDAALDDLGLFDAATKAKVTAGALAYAHDRAAELVGKQWVGDTLIDNPDAGWSIPDATRTMIQSTVSDAIERGASNDELAKDIADSVAFSPERSKTIARTETAMADTQGNIAGWKASGVVAGKEWQASANCCDECQEMDGEIVGIDDDFPEGDVPLHPNCECVILPVLPEDMPDASDDDTTDEE